jgi:D-serine dehydratase
LTDRHDAGLAAIGARFVSLWPDVEVWEVSCFADSPEAVAALRRAAEEARLDRPIRILAEVGAGRVGARTPGALGAVLAAIRAGEAGGRLQLAGIAVYEASAAGQGIESVDAVLKSAWPVRLRATAGA